MHDAGLVAVIVAILLMAGIPKSSIVVEKKGLRPDRTRPGDVVVLNFYGPGRHVVIDAVISTVYRNTILSVTSLIPPGHVAKLAEDKKFKADEMSSQPVSCKHGGDHVFVPFAMMEDGGTLGAHAHALLNRLLLSMRSLLVATAPQIVALPCLPPYVGVTLDAALAAIRSIAFPRGCMSAFHSRFSASTGLQGSSLLVSSLLDPLGLGLALIRVADTLINTTVPYFN